MIVSVFPVATIPLKCIRVEDDLCAIEPSGCDLYLSDRRHTRSVMCACVVPICSRVIYIHDAAGPQPFVLPTLFLLLQTHLSCPQFDLLLISLWPGRVETTMPLLWYVKFVLHIGYLKCQQQHPLQLPLNSFTDTKCWTQHAKLKYMTI